MNPPEGILLRTCCAPCTTYVHQWLKKNNFSPTGFFYNHNIYPYREYQKRLSTLKFYSEFISMPVIFEENYQLEEFLQQIRFFRNYCGFARIQNI